MENLASSLPPPRRVPARQGVAARVECAQIITIINSSGKQVVDTWAFNPEDFNEYLSMEHCRVALGKLVPQVGDVLVSNRRRPILSLIEDTTAGAHDTLMAACDARRYELLGAVGYHDNCADNLKNALQAIGLSSRTTPAPLNLFMNVPWQPDGTLTLERPTSEAGQYVSLRAEMSLIIVLSACPQDMNPVNDMKSTDVHFRISDQ
jgi:uncharacterized protein YcgI (DUF1989 family)